MIGQYKLNITKQIENNEKKLIKLFLTLKSFDKIIGMINEDFKDGNYEKY